MLAGIHAPARLATLVMLVALGALSLPRSSDAHAERDSEFRPGLPDNTGSYQYQVECPNAQNLIAILGDSDGDRICDAKCKL